MVKNLNDDINRHFGDGGYPRDWGNAFGGQKAKGGDADMFKGGSGGKCADTHPALAMPGHPEAKIYGGSCTNPVVNDADVYIGFDWGMKMTARSWPWKKGVEFLFKIEDMQPPREPAEFRKLVNWTREQILDGKKVHCGCQGGHGRTGTFLAALVSTFGEKDAIGYVRKHYCQKAVETRSQIEFLMKEYGVADAAGSKSFGSTSSKSSGFKPSVVSEKGGGSRVISVDPMQHAGCIWG